MVVRMANISRASEIAKLQLSPSLRERLRRPVRKEVAGNAEGLSTAQELPTHGSAQAVTSGVTK